MGVESGEEFISSLCSSPLSFISPISAKDPSFPGVHALPALPVALDHAAPFDAPSGVWRQSWNMHQALDVGLDAKGQFLQEVVKMPSKEKQPP